MRWRRHQVFDSNFFLRLLSRNGGDKSKLRRSDRCLVGSGLAFPLYRCCWCENLHVSGRRSSVLYVSFRFLFSPTNLDLCSVG